MSSNLIFSLFFTVFLVSSAFPTAETAGNIDEDTESKLFELFNNDKCREDSLKYTQCFREHTNLTFTDYNATEIREKLEKIGPFLKKAMDCIGELSCGPLVLATYMIRNSLYREECLLEAAECIESSNITHIRDYCNSTISPMIQDKLSLKIHVARCVAARLNETMCNEKDRIVFLRGEFAKLDAGEVGKTLVGSDGKPSPLTFFNFHKQFDPKVYLDVEL